MGLASSCLLSNKEQGHVSGTIQTSLCEHNTWLTSVQTRKIGRRSGYVTGDLSDSVLTIRCSASSTWDDIQSVLTTQQFLQGSGQVSSLPHTE